MSEEIKKVYMNSGVWEALHIVEEGSVWMTTFAEPGQDLELMRVDQHEEIVHDIWVLVNELQQEAKRYRWLIANPRVQEILDFILSAEPETIDKYGHLIDSKMRQS